MKKLSKYALLALAVAVMTVVSCAGNRKDCHGKKTYRQHNGVNL